MRRTYWCPSTVNIEPYQFSEQFVLTDGVNQAHMSPHSLTISNFLVITVKDEKNYKFTIIITIIDTLETRL